MQSLCRAVWLKNANELGIAAVVMQAFGILAVLLTLVVTDAKRDVDALRDVREDQATAVRADGSVVHFAHKEHASIRMVKAIHPHERDIDANGSSATDEGPDPNLVPLPGALVPPAERARLKLARVAGKMGIDGHDSSTNSTFGDDNVPYEKMRYLPTPKENRGVHSIPIAIRRTRMGEFLGLLRIQPQEKMFDHGAWVSWYGPEYQWTDPDYVAGRTEKTLKVSPPSGEQKLWAKYVQWVYPGQYRLLALNDSAESAWRNYGFKAIRLFKSEKLLNEMEEDDKRGGSKTGKKGFSAPKFFKGITEKLGFEGELEGIELFGLSEDDAWDLTAQVTSGDIARCRNVPNDIRPGPDSPDLIDETRTRRRISFLHVEALGSQG